MFAELIIDQQVQMLNGPLFILHFREPDIPKNSSLTYEIELKDVEASPAFFKLPISVRIQLR
jgi:hypothetical protein